MTETNEKIIKIFSEKEQEYVEFNLEDETLENENYECIGCSNADYGS